ncbi:MAG TPA: GGDEF domain-containing protein [Devosia sp.]|nr:GGDEF domain-containing protein [Devosia sp.]
MTGIGGQLPGRAWLHVKRVSVAITLVSVAISVIFTLVFMHTFSQGINLQGLIVAIATPLLLGGPLMFFIMLKHEQLRHAYGQLEQIAATDWLTSCLNRNAFTAAIDTALAGPGRPGRGALLIVDADDFKTVDDRFGHDAGDHALKLIALAIRQGAGEQAIIGRLRGEEFGIFLPAVTAISANDTADLIRRAVAAIQFAPTGTPYRLSVSIGGAAYTGEAECAALFRLADQRLVDVKAAKAARAVTGQLAAMRGIPAVSTSL